MRRALLIVLICGSVLAEEKWSGRTLVEKAFATDDVLLYGFVSSRKEEAALAVVGDFITYEPYGLMYRKDDPLMEAAVARAFSTMARTRTLFGAYETWFLQRTPTGELLNLPISPQLAETFRVLGAGDF